MSGSVFDFRGWSYRAALRGQGTPAIIASELSLRFLGLPGGQPVAQKAEAMESRRWSRLIDFTGLRMRNGTSRR